VNCDPSFSDNTVQAERPVQRWTEYMISEPFAVQTGIEGVPNKNFPFVITKAGFAAFEVNSLQS